ncbi:membrane protein [Mycoplasma wenyonii str. Massachusetts]|uniref:Membrane protein n=1 Tax=Mycoplasma wenyonii (strain Massachusetts) TaxID=1197325 RepID=I6Z5J5_MYCWM|nr:hypothetical protein [Mycoplasma wenyonii]AFN64813.1 membrane protein [Mycoplasma wenyonii str. Massachusetts]
MQLVNTYLFNYRTNFNSFFRTERLSKLLIILFLIISSLVITNLFSKDFWKELRLFVPYKVFNYLKEKEIFKKYWVTNFSVNDFSKNIFSWKIYVYGAFFLLTIESIRLFFKCKRITNKWNSFSLSFGINENQKIKKVKKEIIRTFGNVIAFGIVLLLYLGFIFYVIINHLIRGNYNFSSNFILKRIIFALFFWITLTFFYFLNIQKRIKKYYRNYYQKKDVNKKIDYLVVTKSFSWHLLLNLFGCFMVVLNIPIDLFIIFMVLKFIPWNNIFSKIKLLINKESNLLNLSY